MDYFDNRYSNTRTNDESRSYCSCSPCFRELFPIPKRYTVSFLTFVGSCFLYVLRTNLSIAIIEMTSARNTTIGNISYTREAEFDWTPLQTGLIFSSFSWGFTFAVISGMVGQKIGGATAFGFGIGSTALLTVLTPFFVRLGLAVYVVVRIFEGLFESFAAANISEIFVHWAPPNERTRLVGVAHSGIYIGSALNYSLCGYVAEKFGWENVFYATGGAGLIWYGFWLLLVRNTPAADNSLSASERRFFHEKINYVPVTQYKLSKYPWKKILTSKQVWAYMNERFVQAWSVSFIIYYLPLYIKDVHNVTVTNIGLLAAIPNLFSFCGLVSSSFLADCLRSNNILSISQVHKLYVIIAQSFAVVFLILAGLGESFEWSMFCFCVCRFWYCFADSTYDVIPVDLFSRYASVITGMSFTFLNFGYLINSIVMPLMVSNHTHSEWGIYFLFLSAFNIWGGIIFVLFGSGKPQKWAVHATRPEIKIHDAPETCAMMTIPE